uniref:Tudor domain-containing protein n=1 Tax=Proboscia inermis TaxID=420281 RepID=A0A7S0C071_9STRA
MKTEEEGEKRSLEGEIKKVSKTREGFALNVSRVTEMVQRNVSTTVKMIKEQDGGEGTISTRGDFVFSQLPSDAKIGSNTKRKKVKKKFLQEKTKTKKNILKGEGRFKSTRQVVNETVGTQFKEGKRRIKSTSAGKSNLLAALKPSSDATTALKGKMIQELEIGLKKHAIQLDSTCPIMKNRDISAELKNSNANFPCHVLNEVNSKSSTKLPKGLIVENDHDRAHKSKSGGENDMSCDDRDENRDKCEEVFENTSDNYSGKGTMSKNSSTFKFSSAMKNAKVKKAEPENLVSSTSLDRRCDQKSNTATRKKFKNSQCSDDCSSIICTSEVNIHSGIADKCINNDRVDVEYSGINEVTPEFQNSPCTVKRTKKSNHLVKSKSVAASIVRGKDVNSRVFARYTNGVFYWGKIEMVSLDKKTKKNVYLVTFDDGDVLGGLKDDHVLTIEEDAKKKKSKCIPDIKKSNKRMSARLNRKPTLSVGNTAGTSGGSANKTRKKCRLSGVC